MKGIEITRRDFLKVSGLVSLYSLLPSNLWSSFNFSKMPPSKGPNLIFVVGDGMPLGVIRAYHEISTRVWKMENTHIYTLMKDRRTVVSYQGTKSLSSIVTDSAPASAAWATGSKTANRMLATLPDGTPLKTILELLKERGIACGLVTTTRITHATPAAWVSHQINRDAEDDIAYDYLKFKAEVYLGGGNRHFDPNKRKDKKDLYNEFRKAGYDVLRDKKTLLSEELLISKRPLLGIFNDSHLNYYVDRINNSDLGSLQPTLAEMTYVALWKLAQNPNGFILQIEAGRIDHANHSNDAWGAIMDTYELDITLGVIREFIKYNPNTLVIITSDHGNSGWGINGTGPDYNYATSALQKYTNMKASFEIICKKLKENKDNLSAIKDIVYQYTGYVISNEEAQMLSDSMQPGYISYPGDFKYQPDATLGKILAHNIYDKKGAIIVRGNVGWTSTNHTAEDQIVIVHGIRAKELGIPGYIDNTDLFNIMCRYFGIKYTNPTMSEEEAKKNLKMISMAEWEKHLNLHIA